MKKLFLILIVVFASTTVLLGQGEKAVLGLDLKTTFNDNFLNSEGDTLIKPGAFADNYLFGKYYFGNGVLQAGAFVGYKFNSLYRQDMENLFKINSEVSAGMSLRMSSSNLEFDLGLGYLYQSRTDKNVVFDQNQEEFTIVERLSKSPGLIVPLSFHFDHERLILPKLSFSAEQRFFFTDKFAESYFEVGELSFRADAQLIRLVIPFMPEAYLSPTIGLERVTNIEDLVYKAGVTISSNGPIRTDIVKIGYFRERNIYGVEGVYLSLNLMGLITIL
jgi:hypothetical protein